MTWLYVAIAILTFVAAGGVTSRRRRRQHDLDIGDYYKDRTKL